METELTENCNFHFALIDGATSCFPFASVTTHYSDVTVGDLGNPYGHGNMDEDMATWSRTWKHGQGQEKEKENGSPGDFP